jgi:hypothetical protein
MSEKEIGLNLKRVAIFLILAILWPAMSFAASPISVVFFENHNCYQIEGCFSISANRYVIWKVLTNYNHISDFVQNMKFSHVKIQKGNNLLLEQNAVEGFLFFTKTIRVLLDVHEVPEKFIYFRDVNYKDFKFYQGYWAIKSAGASKQVFYSLAAQANFSAPAFLSGGIAEGSVLQLLKSVRKEILVQQTISEKKTIETVSMMPIHTQLKKK